MNVGEYPHLKKLCIHNIISSFIAVKIIVAVHATKIYICAYTQQTAEIVFQLCASAKFCLLRKGAQRIPIYIS